ncbi:MAG: RsmB/NOP family class I SAM-dependent RNA methyltransferase, partial [Calditrichota bacterium]
ALEELAAAKITDEPTTLMPGFIQLHRPCDLNQIELFKSAALIAQDVSQGLVASLVAPKDKERILDMCSAPGGKTGHLAELGPDCEITATDKSEDRLPMVIDLINRAGYSNVSVIPYQEALQSKQTYNAVLVDAPCSGTGVLARRPDLRWRLRPDDFARMAAIQVQLLRYAAERTAKLGRIIYATCSVDPVENQEVVNRFLSDNSAFRISTQSGLVPANLINSNHAINLRGEEIAGDGVFALCLERWK